jgi:leucine dehydrogenase
MRAVLEEVFGSPSFKGRCVLLQGVGAVGGRLAELCAEAGARVIICDINDARVAELSTKHGFESVPDATHLDTPCDLYAPCARGATINDQTIGKLRCKAIAGCANNQLHEPRHGDELRQRGILYAPDYVINAGGIINVSMELYPGGYDEAKSVAKIDRIYDNLKQVFRIAREQKISTHVAADQLADQRIAAGRKQGAAVSGR